jgi:hypothetical protein
MNTMTKKGRPKLYYDFIQNKSSVVEPLDLCLQMDLINFKQHRLALRLRWLYTISFGLPTVQAYNIGKIPGREISKYDDITVYERRQEYKKITEILYKEDRGAAKLFLKVIIHHYRPAFFTLNTEYKSSKEKELIKSAAETLEHAYKNKLKEKIYIHNNQTTNNYIYET